MNHESPESVPGPIDPAKVTLREITADTVGAVIRLALADTQKGFVATNEVSLAQALFAPEARYQGRGIGRAALLLVIEHVKAKGLFTSLQLSYVPGPGCPEAFYRALGFRPTGRVDDGELVMELPLQADTD